MYYAHIMLMQWDLTFDPRAKVSVVN